ncbi:type II secretion system minor pseudopilin GspI [Geotalea sp. SG265]|uniref:type II secretion system minor pseudopilin GspI n=1 Tax=Geotalea sp. SG265 TaxID=2922867 RepID=UPI001FAFCE2B
MKGFTLLEIMVALAIMAGVILTVITSFNYHLSVVGRDREETAAVLLARAKLEEPGFTDLQKKDGTFAPDHPEIAWHVETEGTEMPTLQKLILTVTWGEKQSLSLVQYYAKK